MTTITHDGGVITPTIVDGWSAAREVRTIAHTILGRPDPDVTFRPAGLRAGTLRLVFAAEAAAAAASDALATPQVLTIVDADRSHLAMSFVVTGGDLSVTLDDETRDVWIVEVPYREVSP